MVLSKLMQLWFAVSWCKTDVRNLRYLTTKYKVPVIDNTFIANELPTISLQ